MDEDSLVLSPSDIYPIVQRFLSHANFRCTVKVFQEEAGLDDNLPKAKHRLAKLLEALDLTSACQQWINSHGRTTVVRGDETRLSRRADPIAVLQDCLRKDSVEGQSKDATRKRRPEDTSYDTNAKAARRSSSRFEVYIGDIPFSVDEAAIRKKFSKCGTITNFHMPRKPDGSSNGYCFVAYDCEEAAKHALKYNGREYQGRKLQVNLQGGEKTHSRVQAKSSAPVERGDKKEVEKENYNFRICIDNLPSGMDEAAVKKKFSKSGTIRKCVMPQSQGGSSNERCFITYDTEDAVCAALRYNGKTYDGCELKISRESEQDHCKSVRIGEKDVGLLETPVQKQTAAQGSSSRVFIGNLPTNVDADGARKKFSKCGAITDFFMPFKPNGKSRRFCFITYDSEDSVTAVLKYNGREYEGRVLKVNVQSAPALGEECPR